MPPVLEKFYFRTSPNWWVTPAEGPYNQTWILGDTKHIPYSIQGRLNYLQEITSYDDLGSQGVSGLEALTIVWYALSCAGAVWIWVHLTTRMFQLSPFTEELSRYGHVQRIPGKDPWKMSTGFAGYKDVGRNFGWWIDKTTRSFGWGIAEAGHNFTFINPEYPAQAVPAAILSHMGKHGPFLLVKDNEIPVPVAKYLQTVQPSFISSQEQLFNHGWLIGSRDLIGSEVLQELETLLQVKNMGDEKE